MDKIRLCDVEVDALVTETRDALCVRLGKKNIWLPKSLTEYDPYENKVTLPEWLAQDKELI